MTISRNKVKRMIRERIAQAVILSHHIQSGTKPNIDYVEEKEKIMPSLDGNNQAIFDKIADILNSKYDVEIEYKVW